MAVIAPTLIFDLTAGGWLRLRGNLAAGAVLPTGNSYRERLRVPVNAVSVDVRCHATVSGGAPTLQLVPQRADRQTNDLTVSDATAGLAAATLLVNGSEVNHSYTPKGELFVDVVIDASGPGASGSVSYCDVGIRLQ